MGLIAFAPLTAMADETATLRFILTGDHYILAPQKGRGGYAKLASVVLQEKASTKHSISCMLEMPILRPYSQP